MLWYEYNSKSIDISTRIRIARNLKGVPFISRLSHADINSVCRKISEAVLSSDLNGLSLRKIEMDTLGDIEVYSMVERHCISPKFAETREGRILLLSDNESVSIMIGEEDHLRIQVLKPKECLAEAYKLCDSIETAVSQKLEFAFDSDFGYLTECPTNLGTALRASVMVHIPLLEKSGELRALARLAGKLGLTVRGFYGEGSNSKAGFYQISNQVTLGQSENVSIENLQRFTSQVIDREGSLLCSIDTESLTDTAYRSFGTLKYARKMSTEEMMQNINVLLLGQRAEAVALPENVNLVKLFITLQPSMINRLNGETAANERDIIRANSLREALKNIEP